MWISRETSQNQSRWNNVLGSVEPVRPNDHSSGLNIRIMPNMKITFTGADYVGFSNAIFLFLHNPVVAVEIIPQSRTAKRQEVTN